MLAFLICLIASAVGAVAGFGGGVIIKPLFDFLGLMPVATVSFLSGCTVLAMTVSSLIRTRKSPVKVDVAIATPLAVGAALGGLAGKWLFELARGAFAEADTLGGIQSVCLVLLNLLVLVYVCKKEALPSAHLKNPVLVLVIGALLGTVSSFIGIGGGPINIAVLFLFFSMDAKTAAKNSIYIIMFSQAASVLSTLIGGTVPDFRPPDLVLMMAGGVGGALLGASASRRMNARHVEVLLKVLLVLITAISVFNSVKFFL